MKLTILVDNYVPNVADLLGEPSFSCFIEDEEKKILFDTGFGAVPFKNARDLGIDLASVDCVVLSHGHFDHTRGLNLFAEKFASGTKTMLLCHPDALKPKRWGRNNIGIKGTEKDLGEKFTIVRSGEPVWITDRIVFLGEIERTTAFENKNPLGKTKRDGAYVDDYLLDDSALAIDTDSGIVVVTGCSHSGICNIIEYAKKVVGKRKIRFVLGGFHLQCEDPADEQLRLTVANLARENMEIAYPCHCTNLLCKTEISKAMRIGEVGSGSSISF